MDENRQTDAVRKAELLLDAARTYTPDVALSLDSLGRPALPVEPLPRRSASSGPAPSASQREYDRLVRGGNAPAAYGRSGFAALTSPLAGLAFLLRLPGMLLVGFGYAFGWVIAAPFMLVLKPLRLWGGPSAEYFAFFTGPFGIAIALITTFFLVGLPIIGVSLLFWLIQPVR